MSNIKKRTGIILTVLAMCFMGLMPSFAETGEPIPEPDPATRTDVTVNVHSPELYQGELEFYCGNETFYITVNEGETLTVAKYNVPKGETKIGFLDSNDIADSFEITYKDRIDPEKEPVIDVVIDYSKNVTEDIEDEGDEGVEVVVVSPAEYDFSEGGEYGTIFISCTPYGSVDSAVLTLMGDKLYEITLDSEHNFQANVYLKPGMYKELTNIKVTPNELATVPSDLTFSWAHRDSNYFGNNYTVTNGSYFDLTNLYIQMNYQGDLREVDDLILLQTKIRSQFTELTNERREEFLEEFTEEAPTIEEPKETEPAVAEAVDNTDSNKNKLIIIGILGAVLVLFGAVIIVRRKKNQ